MRCVRCDRPACPDCLRAAAVGYQCVDCVREGARDVRTPTTVAGARPGGRPLIVPLLIAVNVAVFVVTVVQAKSLNQNDAATLFRDGSLWPPVVAYGEWWRLFTSGFLHFGPIHLLLNMASLYFVGRDLELVLGRLRFTALYVLSLFGGGVSVFLFGIENQSVAGASGAIFGLLGALLVVVFRMKLNVQPVVLVIVLNVALSITVPGISLLGHLGGLVVGLLAAVGLVFPKPARRAVVQVGTFVALSAVLVLLFLVRDAQFGNIYCLPEVLRCVYANG